MDTGTIRTIGIVGACVLGIFLFVKSIEMKENRKAEEYLTANLPKAFSFNDVDSFLSFMGGKPYDVSFYNNMKEEYGACTILSQPKCKPYTRQGGCPYTRENMRCDLKLRCKKIGRLKLRIDLNRSGYAVNDIQLSK